MTKSQSNDPRINDLMRRGYDELQRGHLDSAIASFSMVIELDRSFAGALINRGTAYHNKGDLDRAIADYDVALHLNGYDGQTYFERGTVHAEKGDYDCAIADYDTAVWLLPDLAMAHCNRGMVHHRRGITGKPSQTLTPRSSWIPVWRQPITPEGLLTTTPESTTKLSRTTTPQSD